MIKNSNNNQLASLVYIHAMRKEIEKEIESKYSKRIDYLVNANNELMNELEQCESEIITVTKECYGRGI
jgi:demethoxyubiquinone hydroxylase (CLK1/Coq7/Cat5 family)